MNGGALMQWLRTAARHPLPLMIAGIVVMIALTISIGTIRHMLGISDTSPPLVQLGVSILTAALFLGAYALFVHQVEHGSPRDLAFQGAGRQLLAGLCLGVGAMTLTIGAIAVLGGYSITGRNPATVLVPVAAMAILSGVTEEVIIRGIIFRHLEQWLGSWIALALSAALFGALHLGNPNATALAAIAIALEAGILLAALYMLTRRLWSVIGLHAGWNFTQGGIFGVAVSGHEEKGLFISHMSGTDLLTGGPFGAEASVPAMTICTALGLACLWRAWKHGQIKPVNLSGK